VGWGKLNCVSRFYNLQVNIESILHRKQRLLLHIIHGPPPLILADLHAADSSVAHVFRMRSG